MSTIRDTYPTKINGTNLFRPESWKVSREVMETSFKTEAGTDQVLVQRTGKTTIAATFACTAAWLATFQGWNDSGSALTVKFYDPSVPGYAEKSMRMRNFSYDLLPHSDYLTDSQSLGLYTVSFDLIEF